MNCSIVSDLEGLERVDEFDIQEMFQYADTNGSGKLSYDEFSTTIDLRDKH